MVKTIVETDGMRMQLIAHIYLQIQQNRRRVSEHVEMCIRVLPGQAAAMQLFFENSQRLKARCLTVKIFAVLRFTVFQPNLEVSICKSS